MNLMYAKPQTEQQQNKMRQDLRTAPCIYYACSSLFIPFFLSLKLFRQFCRELIKISYNAKTSLESKCKSNKEMT